MGSAALGTPPLTLFFLCYFLPASLRNCSTQMCHRKMEGLLSPIIKLTLPSSPLNHVPEPHICNLMLGKCPSCICKGSSCFCSLPRWCICKVSAKTMLRVEHSACSCGLWCRCTNGFQSYSRQVPLRCCRGAYFLQLSVKSN